MQTLKWRSTLSLQNLLNSSLIIFATDSFQILFEMFVDHNLESPTYRDMKIKLKSAERNHGFSCFSTTAQLGETKSNLLSSKQAAATVVCAASVTGKASDGTCWKILVELQWLNTRHVLTIPLSNVRTWQSASLWTPARTLVIAGFNQAALRRFDDVVTETVSWATNEYIEHVLCCVFTLFFSEVNPLKEECVVSK